MRRIGTATARSPATAIPSSLSSSPFPSLSSSPPPTDEQATDGQTASGWGKVAIACFTAPPSKRAAAAKKNKPTSRQETPPENQANVRSLSARLEEATALAGALGLTPVHQLVLASAPHRAATLLSGGQCEQIKTSLARQAAELLFVDATLSPSQQRNLENRLKVKVLDRTGVILEIFARRARSAEGRLQVEQAQLTWQRSRLVRSWTHLERQRGGTGKAAGPGERQLELDKRMLEQRLKRTRQRLVSLRRRRGEQRKGRAETTARVALVGYTNAGKSTLFDALTRKPEKHGKAPAGAGEDRLFATLDPLMRKMDLPFPLPVVLSDTVGFVSDLPHGLVEAFHATLEEVRQADLIVHVHDAASPAAWPQAQDVEQVLDELLPADTEPPPVLHVRNKADLLSPEVRQQMEQQASGLIVSAAQHTGLETLRQALTEALSLRFAIRRAEVFLPHSTTQTATAELRAWLYRNGLVEAQTSDEIGECLSVCLDRAASQRLQHLAKTTANNTADDTPWLEVRWQAEKNSHDPKNANQDAPSNGKAAKLAFAWALESSGETTPQPPQGTPTANEWASLGS